MNGKHRDDAMTDGHYGRHSRAHADVPVADVLQAVFERGDATRLAWPADEADRVVEQREEFPTGVLPVVRPEQPASPGVDDTESLTVNAETEPTTTSAAHRLRPGSFSWWPRALAG
jgi:hypothetical protein